MELKSHIELQKSRLLIGMFPDPPKPPSRVGFNAAKPLPCFDESDDGVPPICQGEAKWWKLFNHAHPLTNKNVACAIWSNIGFKYFDWWRHRFMALSFLATLVSIAFTIFGCLALSTDRNLVQVCTGGAGHRTATETKISGKNSINIFELD